MQKIAGDLPKSLIPIEKKPFLHYQLTWLGRQGISDVVMCTGYGADQIERYAKDGRAWGLTLRYVNEGDRQLGTGGALRLALDKGCLQAEFAVIYGDSFLPIDFSPLWAYFQSRKEPALMVVLKNDGRWDKSNVNFDGQKVTRYDKRQGDPGMRFIDYGLNFLRSAVVQKEFPAQGAYDLADCFHTLSERGDLAGYEVKNRFYEIGSPQGLKDFSEYLSTSPI